jgi:fibronectin-binding autotransporter adhesin
MKSKTNPVFPSKLTFSIIASVAGMLTSAHAADNTWDGSDSDAWSLPANWTTVLPNSDNAHFTGSTPNNSINLAAAVPIFQLEFNNTTAALANYSFGGAQFQASGSGSNISVNANVTNGPTITWNNNIQSTTTNRVNPGGFSINTANGSNSNLIFNGNLFASIGTAGIISTIDFKLSNAAASGSTTVNGLIIDSGLGKTGITKTGGGNGTLTINGPNTFSGQTVWNTDSGSFVLGNKAALGTGAIRVAGTNTTNSLSASTPLVGATAVTNTFNFLGTTFNNTSNLVLSVVSGTNTGTIVSGTAPKVGDMVTAGVTTFLSASTRITAVSGTIVGSTVTFDLNALATGNTAALTTGPTATNNAVVSVTAGSPTGALVSGVAPNAGDLVSVGGGAHIPLYTRVLTVVGSGPGAVITFDTNAATTGNTAALTTVAYANSSTGTLTVGGTNAIEFSGPQNLSTVYSNGTAATRTYQITNTADTTLSGVLQELNGVAGLTKTGTGRLILSNTNTYTGTTTISAGTLRLAGGTAIADASAVSLGNIAGAILDLNDTNETVASITGGGVTGGNVSLGAGTLTVAGTTSPAAYAGAIGGTGGFTRTSASGTTTLTGASSYSGLTTIQNGTINVGANNVLSGTNGPLGNSTGAIILGTASTVASSIPSGSPPNVHLIVQGAAVSETLTLSRDVDSSATADVAGRNNIRYNHNTVGALGTLTVSGNWLLSSGTVRSNGLTAQQPGQTLDYTGIISGGNSGTRFRVNDFGSGTGKVRLSNSANSYASQTTVTNGTLLIAGDAAAATGVLGTNATVILAEGGNGSTDNAALTDGAFVVGKTISLQNGTTTTSTWTVGGNQPVVSSFTGNVSTVSNANSRTLRLSQVAGGSVSFDGVIGANPNATATTSIDKIGAGTVSLTNTNAYDGNTTVTDGTLSMSAPSMADTSTLTIGTVALSAAILDLPNAGTDTVAALVIDGVAQSNGLYDSTNSGGAITGPGKIQVGAGGSDYTTWIDLFPSITGADKLSTADPDQDGLTNQQEYAFGLIPNSGSSVNPITVQLDKTTGLFSYTRRLPSLSGLAYTYVYSTNLASWTPFTPDSAVSNAASPTETIIVDVPNALLANPSLFIRIIAQ